MNQYDKLSLLHDYGLLDLVLKSDGEDGIRLVINAIGKYLLEDNDITVAGLKPGDDLGYVAERMPDDVEWYDMLSTDGLDWIEGDAEDTAKQFYQSYLMTEKEMREWIVEWIYEWKSFVREAFRDAVKNLTIAPQ